MVFAQLERRMISARTKSALAEARSRGVTLGRPSKTTQELRNIVRDAYNRMGSQQRTADELNRVGLATPTGQGRRWYRTTVARALQTVI